MVGMTRLELARPFGARLQTEMATIYLPTFRNWWVVWDSNPYRNA